MKKWMSMLLCAIMIVSALAGCSGGGNSSKNDSSTPSASNSQADASKADSTPTPSGDATTLTVSIFDRGTTTAEFGTVTDNRYVDWINETFGAPNNINVEFYPIPRSEEVNKLNALMASKDAPDVVFTYTDSVYYNFAKQGGLAALDDLLAQYGEHINTNLAECLPYGQYNGVQYAIYAKRAARDITGHYIRKDWCDKLGITLRTDENGFYTMNIDELHDALVKFRDADVDQTGQQIFAMGMSGSGNQGRSVTGIRDAFMDAANITAEQIACEPEFMWAGVKEGFRWLNKCYNEGLMDPDYGTQSDTTKKAEYVTANRTGYWTDDSWWQVNVGAALEALNENNPDAEVVALKLENVYGKMMQQNYPPTAIICMVPVFSKAQTEAVKYLDWLADYENDKVLRYGFEGENYTLVDGVPTDIHLDYQNLSDYALMYNGDPDATVNTATVVASLPEFTKTIRTQNLQIGIEGGYTPYPFGQEIVALTNYKTDLDAKIAELYVNSIMASPDQFDTVWDQYAQEYLTIGGQQVIDEKKAVYAQKEGK